MSDDRYKDPQPDRFFIDRNQPVGAEEMRAWLRRFEWMFNIKKPEPAAPMTTAPDPLPSVESQSEEEP